MPVVSITRLKLRSARYLPAFLWLASGAARQARRADDCLASDVRAEPGQVFWTRSVWRDAQALMAYMTAGPHARAMPRLQHWCSEAAVARWDSETAAPPSWEEARARLKAQGRLSRVRHPSPAQAAGELAT